MNHRFVPPAILLCLILGIPSAGAAQDRPTTPADPDYNIPSKTSLLKLWSRSAPALVPLPPQGPSLPTDRAGALEVLSGGLPFADAPGARCATPLLLSLHQNRSTLAAASRHQFEQVTVTSPGGRWLASPDGAFIVHYTVDPLSIDRVDPYDGNLDGVPDGVTRVAEALADVLADIVHKIDWPPAPLPSPTAGNSRASSDAIHVHLVGTAGPGKISRPGDGFTAPLGNGSGLPRTGDASGASIYLDSRTASTGEAPRDALAHQVAHVILIRESVNESPWWHEATAAWLESRLVANAPARARWFGAGSARRAAGLDEDPLGLDLASFLWPHFLTLANSDLTLVRHMWMEMAAIPGNNTMEGMDRVLRKERGSSLAQEVGIFTLWNLFSGRSDDRRHYPFGALLPTPRNEGTHEAYPVSISTEDHAVPALRSALFRLLGDSGPGGLRIVFRGDPAFTWEISLLVYDRVNPSHVRLIPLEQAVPGETEYSLPWQHLAFTDVLLQNLSLSGSPAAEYSLTIDRDATIPFELLSLAATPAKRGALIEWTTEREDRIAGWNILRGDSLLGPFSRVNTWMVPGTGPLQGATYGWMDESTRPGRKYYYVVEGITIEGFATSSYPTGARLPRRRPIAASSDH